MIFRDYYRILELDTNKVNLNQIKSAYRELAKKYHPDLNIGNKRAEERFKDINEAYRVLTDPSGKRKYDRMWVSRIGSRKRTNKIIEKETNKEQEDTIFSEFFNMFFGSMKEAEPVNKKIPTKGENIETEINIKIEDGFYGTEKKLSLKDLEGKAKVLSVKIPSGIRNGEKIRLLGQGKEGKNGGKNGDMLIKINILDSVKYRLEGCNILQSLYITPWEAALGTRVDITGINEEITIYIPAGIQSGEKIRIAQKGYHMGDGTRGDMVIEMKIAVQKKLSEEEKKLYEEMQKISDYNPRIGR